MAPSPDGDGDAAAALALARRVNLIEALTEELGRCVLEDDDAAETMTEEEIRAAFAAAAAAPAAAASPPPLVLLRPEPDPAAFRAWFPRAAKTTNADSSSSSRPLILCFPPAGCGEDVYTFEGATDKNPLVSWCLGEGGADLLAAQPPGRGARLREPAPATLREYASLVAPLVARRVALAPWWAVVGHSMGAWAAVEVASAVAEALGDGDKPPAVLAVSAIPPPDWPPEDQPWRQQRTLDDAQFALECRAWDVSDAVFEESMWRLFSPCLRADFKLFDEYIYPQDEGLATTVVKRGGGGGGGGGEVVLGWGRRDRRVTREMVAAWTAWVKGGDGGNDGNVRFTEVEVDGHHLWPLERRQQQQQRQQQRQGEEEAAAAAGPDPRAVWFDAIVGALGRAAAHYNSD
jgi:surfactin synthase thioesterase subunit